MRLGKLLKAFWIAFLQTPSQKEFVNRHNSHLDDDLSSDTHRHISDDSLTHTHDDITDHTSNYVTNPIYSFLDFNVFHDIFHHDDHNDWHHDDWHNDWHHDW